MYYPKENKNEWIVLVRVTKNGYTVSPYKDGDPVSWEVVEVAETFESLTEVLKNRLRQPGYQ